MHDAGIDAGSDARPCTFVGCGLYEAELTVTYAGPEFDLVNGRFTICRNATCVEAVLPNVPLPAAGMYGQPFEGALNGELLIWHTDQQFSIVIGIFGPGPYAAGDVYTVTLRAQDDRILVEDERTAVSYSEYLPNGPGCAPVCISAVFE